MKYLFYILVVFIFPAIIFSQNTLPEITQYNKGLITYQVTITDIPQKFCKYTIILASFINDDIMRSTILTIPVKLKNRADLKIQKVIFKNNDFLVFQTNIGTYTFPITIVHPGFNFYTDRYLKPKKI